MADAQDEKFAVNLLRAVAASLYFQNGLVAAREMYGRSYFSLGIGEKAAVDQAVFVHVSGNYQGLTPEFLADQQQVKQPIGFPVVQVPTPTPGSTPQP